MQMERTVFSERQGSNRNCNENGDQVIADGAAIKQREANPNHVIINEPFNPSGVEDSVGEWIELYNPTENDFSGGVRCSRPNKPG